MSSLVTAVQKFDVNKIRFTKPRANEHGGKTIGMLNADTGRSIFVNVPLMMTYGATKRENPNTGAISWDFHVQFKDKETASPNELAALNKFIEIEKHVRETAIEKSKEWFGKVIKSEDVLDAMTYPMIKYPKDKETGEPLMDRPPTMKVKLNTWEGKAKFEVYDMNHNVLVSKEQEECDFDQIIEQKSSVACILQCGGVYIGSGKMSISWKLYQAVVKPTIKMEEGKCMVDVGGASENTSDTKQAAAYDSDGENVETSDNENVENTSETSESEEVEVQAAEEEEEEEPEPEPEPEPKKKKSGGRKKASA